MFLWGEESMKCLELLSALRFQLVDKKLKTQTLKGPRPMKAGAGGIIYYCQGTLSIAILTRRLLLLPQRCHFYGASIPDLKPNESLLAPYLAFVLPGLGSPYL